MYRIEERGLKLEVEGIHHIIIRVYASSLLTHKVTGKWKPCCESKVNLTDVEFFDPVEEDIDNPDFKKGGT